MLPYGNTIGLSEIEINGSNSRDLISNIKCIDNNNNNLLVSDVNTTIFDLTDSDKSNIWRDTYNIVDFTTTKADLFNFKDLYGVTRSYYKLILDLNTRIDISNINLSFYNFNRNLDAGLQAYIAPRGIIEDVSYVSTKSNLRFEDFIVVKIGNDF